jgi:hypothetical protein
VAYDYETDREINEKERIEKVFQGEGLCAE